MSDRCKIDDMAKTIMEGLQEYANLATDDVKTAVRKAGKTAKADISANAPKQTGAYAKSWAVRNVSETSYSLHVTVHSKNRYQLAHLLEHGHAKRGGGRVGARPHIQAAEEKAIKQLEDEITKKLGG